MKDFESTASRIMHGIIGIDHLSFYCCIGIEPHEKDKEQKIVIDIKMKTDFSTSVVSEEIKDTIDYAAISELCITVAKSKNYQLLETLAHDILKSISVNYSISWAWIKIHKPAALKNAQACYVELEWPFL